MDNRLEDILLKAPIFSELGKQDIETLARLGERRRWPKGSLVISEGERGDAAFLLLSGKVKVNLYGKEGREIVLAIMEPGDLFGEMSLLDDELRSANVETIEDSEFFIIRREAFLRYLKEHPEVAIRLLTSLAGRIREADRKIGGLVLLDVCGRIASTLIGIARASGDWKGKGMTTIDRLTHEELAALIGSSREVVTRALKKMVKEGYLRIEKDRFILFID